jgi:8-oxo-dGTP pyrophosphatase MutT (NUDIX family)
MPRAQCIVLRDHKLLMAKHHDPGGEIEVEWWCLPGGGIEAGETPAEAAIRELYEECGVEGTIVCETARVSFDNGPDGPRALHYTFLIDIGDQEVRLGADPEFAREPGLAHDNQALLDVRWLALHEIPERDRAFLWAAGLLGVGSFPDEVERWGDRISYPGRADGE